MADGVAGTAATSTEVQIVDSAPTAPVVSLEPVAARTDQDLVVNLPSPSVDADGDDVTYTYAWYRADGPMAALTGDQVPASETTVGERWEVRVTPSAGGVDGPTVASNIVLVAAENGFLVRTETMWPGDLGALSGANAKCLAELQAGDWLGKSQAVDDGLLDADHVQAFLCNIGQCQDPVPSSRYDFAQVGAPSNGGAQFVTSSSGVGPADRLNWSDPTAFGTSGEHWTGRGQGGPDLWPLTGDLLNCFNWQVAGNEAWGGGRKGRTANNSSSRWGTPELRCNGSRSLLCMVHPVPVASEPSACVAPWGEEVPHGDSVIAWQDPVSCDDVCVSEVRSCEDGVLSGSFDQPECAEPTPEECDARGYLVVTSDTWTGGEIGGLTGANAKCLEELTRENWRDKSDAGTLTSDRVEALLCDDSTCQDPEPNAVYQFARASVTSAGGALFQAADDGAGPGDLAFWSDQGHFGTNLFWWSGRAADVPAFWPMVGASGRTCNGWTSTSGFGVRGSMLSAGPAQGATRWDVGGGAGCVSNYSLLCMVHPE